MSLRRTLGIWLLTACHSAFARGAPIPVGPEDEAVEQFLADHELTGLLASHLEARLRNAESYERAEIAERLARVYADLLEASEGVDSQRAWEERSKALLESVPDADSLELRLGLARASYKRIEKVAEDWRLRIGEKEEIEVAARRFEELVIQFEKVASEANERVKTLEHQEESARSYDSDLLATALSSARRARSLAHYLAGWCDLYIAEFTGKQESAQSAERHFGWLTNARPGELPEVDRLPQQTLRYAHVARSAIGVGTARSLRGRTDDALAWFDAVERGEGVPAAVKRQLFIVRASALARENRWTQLLEMVMARNAGQPARSVEPMPTPEARLVAVLALEEQASSAGRSLPELDKLRDVALGDLVARGELGHVLELVRRYGQGELGGEGFVPQNIRGLIGYDAAREAHRALGEQLSEPTADSSVARRYLEAADHLRHALSAKDALQYPAAAANATVLLGMSLYAGAGAPGSQGGLFEEAAMHLVAASERLTDRVRAAEAMWMAVRSLQEAIDRKPKNREELIALRASLSDRFIANYPDDDRSAALMLSKATTSEVSASDAIDALLRVPETSSVYEASRRQAARLAYEAFRNAVPAERDWAATRFLSIAEPMLAVDRRRAASGDSQAAAMASVRARQIVDAVLGMSAPDLSRAERALDVLASLVSAGLIDPAPIRGEIDYRRAQLLLVRNGPGDRENAEALVEALQRTDVRYATAASTLFYRDALTTLKRLQRQPSPDVGEVTIAARGVFRNGQRLMEAWSREAGGVATNVRDSVQAESADAAMLVWRFAKDVEARDAALKLVRDLLQRQSSDARLLRLNAELSEAVGETDAALEAWRTLVAGLNSSDPAWYESKYRLIELLLRADPPLARELFDQHKLLYPTFGPEPWGPRIAELESRLPQAPPPAVTPPEGGTP